MKGREQGERETTEGGCHELPGHKERYYDNP